MTQSNKIKTVLIPLAPGIDEMEAISLISILRRAQYHVTTASCDDAGKLQIKGAQHSILTADCALIKLADKMFDAIVLPGGEAGAHYFSEHTLLIEMLKQQAYDQNLVAAIGASPALVFNHLHLFPDALMTCHPDYQKQLQTDKLRAKRVVYDKNHKLMTSQGAGCALELAMEIIILFSGKAYAWSIAQQMVTLPTLHYHKLPSSYDDKL